MGCKAKGPDVSNSDEKLKKLNKVLNYINNKDYPSAVINLEKLSHEDPAMCIGQMNIPILKMECYQATGKFEKIQDEADKAKALWKPTLLSKAIGHDFYDVVLMRVYVKTFNVGLASNLINDVISQHFIEDVNRINRKISTIPLNLVYRGLSDNIMLLEYVYTKNEVDRDYYTSNMSTLIEYLFKFCSDIKKRKAALLFLSDFLGYQYSDGKYHSDGIFANSLFIDKMAQFCKNAGVKKKDIEILYKYSYRSSRSELFDAAWENIFK
jgi:hypothetical protein